jgi:ADP-glucose pyrophosphorylase
MADVEINKDCVINYSIIDEMVKIGPGLKIGKPKGEESEITVIPRESVINNMGGVI